LFSKVVGTDVNVVVENIALTLVSALGQLDDDNFIVVTIPAVSKLREALKCIIIVELSVIAD